MAYKTRKPKRPPIGDPNARMVTNDPVPGSTQNRKIDNGPLGGRRTGRASLQDLFARYGPKKSGTATKMSGTYSRSRLAKKARKPRNRFAAGETVSGAVAQRSGARLAAVGGTVKGVDGTDGYTGREARLIKRARLRQKNSRKTLSS